MRLPDDKGAVNMTYSFTEKKHIRKDFGKQRTILEVPFLLAIQVDSYREFLQENVEPSKRGQERHRRLRVGDGLRF